MDENNTALSQDAIDELLTSQPDEEDETGAASAEPDIADTGTAQAAAGAKKPGRAPIDLSPPAPAQVTVDAPPPPGVTPPPGVVHTQQAAGVVDEERATAIAEGVAESVIAPIEQNFAALSDRINALEAALKKISALEKEVARLKEQKQQQKELLTADEVRPLAERVVKLEKGAKNSPVFNIYEKFTCASCESQGIAQVRTRCASCGKEGWFGRSKAA